MSELEQRQDAARDAATELQRFWREASYGHVGNVAAILDRADSEAQATRIRAQGRVNTPVDFDALRQAVVDACRHLERNVFSYLPGALQRIVDALEAVSLDQVE